MTIDKDKEKNTHINVFYVFIVFVNKINRVSLVYPPFYSAK